MKFIIFSDDYVKKQWKKIKDSTRHLEIKKRKLATKAKSGASSETISGGEELELGALTSKVNDQLYFLKSNQTENFRTTVSLGGPSTVSKRKSTPPSTSYSNKTSIKPLLSQSLYSYSDQPKKKAKQDPALEVASKLTEAISNFSNKSTSEELKNHGLWTHLEQLFTQLGE